MDRQEEPRVELLSTKTECGNLYGWIKKRSHTQKSHQNGEPQRYTRGTQKKKKSYVPEIQRKGGEWVGAGVGWRGGGGGASFIRMGSTTGDHSDKRRTFSKS